MFGRFVGLGTGEGEGCRGLAGGRWICGDVLRKEEVEGVDENEVSAVEG